MGGEYMAYIVIAGVFSLVGWAVQNRLKSVFSHYGKIALKSGMTGAEVAEQMLRHYNIRDVRVVPGKGYLTDHYNPATKTVSLSEPVFHSRSISAAAVAAHECGHAVQHATAYPMLQMRSSLGAGSPGSRGASAVFAACCFAVYGYLSTAFAYHHCRIWSDYTF
jgi:uncharacterized protein